MGKVRSKSQALQAAGLPARVADLIANRDHLTVTKAWRIHQELTPLDMAKRLAMKLDRYVALELKVAPTEPERYALAQALGISSDQLVTRLEGELTDRWHGKAIERRATC